MTQNKSDDRINKKTLPQESINFLYTFTRGNKISVSFIWFTYNVVYYSKPSRVDNSRCWGEMSDITGTKKERKCLR